MDTTLVDSLTPREMLEILNLNAPVSRGVILQRTSEIAFAKGDDQAGAALVTEVGDRLSGIAANMGGMMLVLDEAGGIEVPLMTATSAVQENPTLQAQPTYPQEVLEGSINPIRRRVLKTTVGISTGDLFPQLTTAQGQQAGWGVVGQPPWQDGCDEAELTKQIIETSGQGPTDSLCTLNKLVQARGGATSDGGENCPPAGYRGTPAHFSFRLPEKFERVLSIALTHLTFPGSVYNVGETTVCCTTQQEEDGPSPEKVQIVTPATLQTAIPPCARQQPPPTTTDETALVVDECFSERTLYIRVVSCNTTTIDSITQWLPVMVDAGSYTLESLVAALAANANAVLPDDIATGDALGIYVNAATGFVEFTNNSDNCTIDIAFPPKLDCVSKATSDALRSQQITIDDECDSCPPNPLIKKPHELPGFRRTITGTKGLGPLLGFADYAFGIITNAQRSTIGLPPSTPATRPFTAQTLPLLENPRTFYFVLEDSVNNSFPTFVGSTGAATMSRMILAEFQVPVGLPSRSYTFGTNLPVGFVYNTRSYFGPVDVERLTVKVVDKNGSPVDTRGRSFRFCLELDRLYNL